MPITSQSVAMHPFVWAAESAEIGATMIRLMIVDDQPAIRRGLRMALTAEPDFSVVGEADSGEAALDLVTSLHPDVVLMDIELPHMNGITATRAIQAIHPPVAVIILSIHDDALTRARAVEAGAAAFVAKSMPAETLLSTIRRVAQQPGNTPVVSQA